MIKLKYRRRFLLLMLGLLAWTVSQAAEPDAYLQVALGRAEKIVDGMDLSAEAPNRAQVVHTIAGQYHALHALHDARDAAIASLKDNHNHGGLQEDILEEAIETIEEETDAKVASLHISYCAKLASLLPAEQVDAVKNGMTYNVAPNTFRVYMDMIPDLEPEQKAQILAWLLEAREYAMDGGSSDEKHHWFGKYKGRINNYLSQLGYDLKQAEQDMWKRKRAEKH